MFSLFTNSGNPETIENIAGVVEKTNMFLEID